jgi:imidazole glycerol-phosphate synthase subunit HisF
VTTYSAPRGSSCSRRHHRRSPTRHAPAPKYRSHLILARRIIPCLDVRDGQVVKGVRFRDHRVAGDILVLASRYRDEGADEIVFYDITASPEHRAVDCQWIRRVAAILDIPFCVAGGIRTVADAEAVLASGADKVSINSPALENPALIEDLAMRFGSQCVVVGIDSFEARRGHRTCQYSGDPARARDGGRDVRDWVREVQQRGAGEITLNCMGSDGVRGGFDIEQLSAVRKICRIPLVASGGAGAARDFAEVFLRGGVDAALAASVFHSGEIGIGELKRELRAAGIPVRLTPRVSA